RYAVVPRFRRHAAGRTVLEALDAQRPFLRDGGPLDATAGTPSPDAVLCTRLPTREQFAALARLGEPALLVTAAQLPYIRSLAAPVHARIGRASCRDTAQMRGRAGVLEETSD